MTLPQQQALETRLRGDGHRGSVYAAPALRSPALAGLGTPRQVNSVDTGVGPRLYAQR